MKVCQIMFYGREHKWIDIALRKSPDTNWFIILNQPFSELISDHYQPVEEKIKELKSSQEIYPDNEKIKYTRIEINIENNLVDLARNFRALILYVKEKEYEIICNLTSGPFKMKLALYIASQIERQQISEVFFLNKLNLEKNVLFNLVKPRKKEQELIEIFYNEVYKNNSTQIKSTNLKKLLKICKDNNKSWDLPSLSRTVNKLVSIGYLTEERKGREKIIEISELGLVVCPINDNYSYLKKELYE